MSTRDALAGRPLDQHPAPLDARAGVERVNGETAVERRVPVPDAAELTHRPAVETRPPLWRRAFTLGGMEPVSPRLSGSHVAIVRVAGSPSGSHEEFAGSQPQRPSFRAPPEPWTAPITDLESH